jgi:hypothetical protein
MYIPSYDFDIFDVPQFSPLQAQEFGAETSFRANTPLSFVDWSLNQFAGLMNPRASYPYVQSQFPSDIDTTFGVPFFQGGQSRAEIEAEVARTKKIFDDARAKAANPVQCPEGYSPVSVFGLFSYCGKDLKSGDSSVGTINPSGDRPGDVTAKSLLKGLPQGAGVFLIAVVVIILLFLFVKR